MLLLLLTLAVGSANAQKTNSKLVADFDQQTNVDNLGDQFGTWDKDPNDKTQGCRMSFVSDDAQSAANGMAVRLDYDVDSPNPAYNGFWLKLDSADVSNFNTLTFYIRGDAKSGFTKKLKVEIKDKKGRKDTQILAGITENWQKISIRLKHDKAVKRPFSEFTIVFDDINSRPKVGSIFIDDVALESSIEN
jgi:hypothetical protein